MDLLIAPPSQEREPPANSGRFSGGDNAHEWYPFASAARLPTGEILAAIPPSPEGAIKAALTEALHVDAGYQSLDSFLPFLDAEYPKTAVPLVYIFDRGQEPRYAEGYTMRAALLDGDTRALSRALRITRVSNDVRASAADLLPWIRPMEELSPLLVSMPGSVSMPPASAAYDAWLQKWRSQYLQSDGSLFISPPLAGYNVLLKAAAESTAFNSSGAKFRSLKIALTEKQSATAWLRVGRLTDRGRVFISNDDPRVAIFRAEWASREPNAYRGLLLAAGDELSVGDVAFQQDGHGKVTAQNGSIKMLDGSQAFLGNPFNGNGQVQGDRAGWHSRLSPETAGFAGKLRSRA